MNYVSWYMVGSFWDETSVVYLVCSYGMILAYIRILKLFSSQHARLSVYSVISY